MNEPRNLRTSDVTYSDTLSAPRIGRSTWTSRVSWSAILVGLFVAMAVQFMILSVSLWGKFGLGAVGSITDLNSNSWVVGIWTALAASVGILVGGYVAAWLAGSRTSINGMWHGIAVWGLAVLSSVILSSLGIAGIMGFGLAPSHIINYFGLTGAAATGALGTASSDRIFIWPAVSAGIFCEPHRRRGERHVRPVAAWHWRGDCDARRRARRTRVA